MQHRAVVALVHVGKELPVVGAGQRVADRKLEPVERRHGGQDVIGETGVQIGDRGRVRIEADEHHVQQGIDLNLRQAEVAGIEAGHVLRVPSGLQVALEIVGPGMERAGDHARIALALEEDMATVHAHVVEGAQGPVPGAGHEHLLVEDIGGQEVAGVGEVVGVADELPAPEPDRLLLALEDGRVIVVRRRQGPRPLRIRGKATVRKLRCGTRGHAALNLVSLRIH